MKVMVLAGGPDREREVSLRSGAQVAAALREAGHEVLERDLAPDDLTALDEFKAWVGDVPGVVFPVFHGKWGEGGPVQSILTDRGLAFVGCREASARLCFDKTRTKQALLDAGLPTPEFELVPCPKDDPRLADETATYPGNLSEPVVVKPNDDGSSIDLRLCPDRKSLDAAWAELSTRYDTLLVERMIRGKEMTIGVIADEAGEPVALPPIHIVPATEFYDFQAKYHRDDTQYLFDAVSPEVDAKLRELAVSVFATLGCRQLSRVDLFLDADDQPWVIEVNTLPGFTDHSLLPMAARRSGLKMPALVDRLVRGASR